MNQRPRLPKTIHAFVSAMLLLTGFPSFVRTTTLAAPASVAVTNLKFDFGSTTSPVAAGYQQVANTMLYTAERGSGIEGAPTFRDRGAPDDLRRDFTNGTYGFSVDVLNGDYAVNIITGDNIPLNTTTVTIEGIALNSITSTTGSFGELKTIVTVSDGQMNLAFGRDGRVNAIEMVPNVAPAGLHVEQTSLTTNPSVTFGWDAVEDATSYNVYRARRPDRVYAHRQHGRYPLHRRDGCAGPELRVSRGDGVRRAAAGLQCRQRGRHDAAAVCGWQADRCAGHVGDGAPDLMVKLDGQQIGAALNGYSGEIELSVIG